jgi:roadblock/LC7 domain-containing protein
MIQFLAPVLGTLIDRLVPDKAEAQKTKAEMELKLVEAANQVNIEQIRTNQIEAGHRSIWVAGWRPAIGWACAFGFFWAFVGSPLAIWVMALTGTQIALPDLDTAPLMEMVFAMLGLGGLRSWEKSRGLTK